MIPVLGFVLQCAAAAALVGSGAAVIAWAAMLALGPVTRRSSPSLRGDLALVVAIAPALAALVAMAGTAGPSIATALGLGPDHCPGHSHHFHICFIHSSEPRPALASLGAFALAVWLYRAGALVRALVVAGRGTRRLEALGRLRPGRFPIVMLPGARLCHATGLFRRRIMLSSELAGRLSADELASALAHEGGHLERRDPLAGVLLALAGLFMPPRLAAWFKRAHRRAAEEACDAHAAATVADGATVASALVKVADLQRAGGGPGLAAAAFGGDDLEHRVRALLDEPRPSPARSWGLVLALTTAALFAAAAIAGGEWLHHTTETVLDRLF